MTNLRPANTLLHNVSLRAFNTFGLEARAARYYRATTPGGLREALRVEQPTLVLGGGSNLLLTRDVPGLVLHLDLRGVTVLPKGDYVEVTAAAGENWHAFVLYTIEAGYGGLENLSLIPGSVGASPIQNIGAYGVEVKDRFVSLRAVHRESLLLETFDAEACEFGYRNSVFKQKLAGQYIILEVTFRLTSQRHDLRADYGDVRKHIESQGVGEGEGQQRLAPKHISTAVMAIRKSKLPDPAEIGNSGSFFKNPELTAEEFAAFAAAHPEAPSYELSHGGRKVPAGWLIEQAGWKGHRRGAIGVHDRQALVLVNHGGGVGRELYALAQEIQGDVLAKFGIALEMEVNVF